MRPIRAADRFRGIASLVAVKTTDAAEAKAVEDEMYDVRVKARMIQPNDHKRSGHHEGSDPSPEPILSSDKK